MDSSKTHLKKNNKKKKKTGRKKKLAGRSDEREHERESACVPGELERERKSGREI
jgi:hypothetical protein